ncbi:hypothetical protein JG688_00013101 [Phytophthora aleatoria]|uniref:Uncharacterized protein n=1 Tax=Phytophthora aleatoria TaxID=2496075 RepID=A0A8J5IJM3_9STRA|nr:hypothetical protein JG688_00013101 [Phytophthora aleatoria]
MQEYYNIYILMRRPRVIPPIPQARQQSSLVKKSKLSLNLCIQSSIGVAACICFR